MPLYSPPYSPLPLPDEEPGPASGTIPMSFSYPYGPTDRLLDMRDPLPRPAIDDGITSSLPILPKSPNPADVRFVSSILM